ncbi:MAG TPA: GNAT family protein [Mucilaginibacter sp.]|jgi:RimJ/RimL family protein N-acetyltransferase|nr:GNAT family protein [Mucilaginibacter sp.]
MQLKGNGFTLRDWKRGDEISVQKNADNIKIAGCLYDRFPSPYTMQDAIEWVDRQLNRDIKLNYAIDIDGEVAGAVGLELKEDVYRKTALIGYWLGEQYWGRGIMPEAVKLVTAYAFEHFDFNRIQAGVFSKNPRSMRVLEKAGYQKEAILKSSVLKNGEVLDEHVYAILRQEFMNDHLNQKLS